MDEFGTEGYNGNRSPMYNGSDLSDEGRNSRKPPLSKRGGSGSRFRCVFLCVCIYLSKGFL